MTAPRHIVYSRRYNIGLLGIERCHPFDSRKYGRAYGRLRRQFGTQLEAWTATPATPASFTDLTAVHTPAYLGELRRSMVLARALEVAPLRWVPAWLTRWAVLRPMRWACAGSILAARLALEHGFAVNLSGGYHHAKRGRGEGFCIYSDIGLMVHGLRSAGRLDNRARIAYVDLDAHQGNGVSTIFREDDGVFIFDMFNDGIYPMGDIEALRRVDCPIPIPSGTDDDRYLAALTSELPRFLDGIADVDLVIYNAGTDILEGDPLGRLDVSAEGICERDRFVVHAARSRNIPVVMLLSGGYTDRSHAVIATSVERLLATWALTN